MASLSFGNIFLIGPFWKKEKSFTTPLPTTFIAELELDIYKKLSRNVNRLSWDIWKNVLTIILSYQGMQLWWSTGFQHQIRIEKRQLTLLNYYNNYSQEVRNRCQQFIAPPLSWRFAINQLLQSAQSFISIISIYLYQMQCNVILGWSSSSSPWSPWTVSWIHGLSLILLLPDLYCRSTNEYKLKKQKNMCMMTLSLRLTNDRLNLNLRLQAIQILSTEERIRISNCIIYFVIMQRLWKSTNIEYRREDTDIKLYHLFCNQSTFYEKVQNWDVLTNALTNVLSNQDM